MTRQGVMGARVRRQPRPWRRTRHGTGQAINRRNGFSLVELIIVAAMTAVVLAGLGALTLVSDVQVGRRINSIQEAQEQWGRAVIFIRNEVAEAATLEKDLSSTVYPCNGDPPNPVLVLKGPNISTTPAWTIIYGVVDRPVAEEGLYRGPKLLIRCGPQPLENSVSPPDATFGHLDPTKVNLIPQQQTVLLDRLPANTPLVVDLLGAPGAPANGDPVLDAQLTITMQAGTDSTFGGDQPVRMHVQRNP